MNIHSFYFHGLGGSINTGKAVSFKEKFNTVPISWDRNYDDAFRYYKDNFSNLSDVVLISSSAGVLPIINICLHFPEKIKKVVLLNPGTSMMNINTIPSSIPVKIYSGTNDYGRNVYLQGDKPENHIEIISIPGNHEFKGREDMINKIVLEELK
ncbi:MAG TPA: hypothetical protein P5060_03535 [Candidatus Absconditabacterales bacterium]|nr:hypothetical protein [Candidatus Absconditabacterales bacterium]